MPLGHREASLPPCRRRGLYHKGKIEGPPKWFFSMRRWRSSLWVATNVEGMDLG